MHAVTTLDVLAGFLPLIARCGDDVPGGGVSPDAISLRLGVSLLDRALAERQGAVWPPQLVILGPTQSGKSTLVNLLAGQPLASVSPLAGYTVHAQGFAVGLAEPDLQDLPRHFSGYRHLPVDELHAGDLDAFALAPTPSALELPPCVLWDTPDFDSVDAGRYSRAVLGPVALADAILLVLSKDKYADQSVWDLLALIAPLERPLVVCLNKVDEGGQDALTIAFRQKWSEAFTQSPPLLFVQTYQTNGAVSAAPSGLAAAMSLALAVPRASCEAGARRYLRAHWERWLTPLRAEVQAAGHWESLLNQTREAFLSRYRRDFLDHPQHYDTFQRALAELLALLEIPGLGSGLRRVRRALTWPVRTVLGARRRRRPSGEAEVEILLRLQAHAQDHLRAEIMALREQRGAASPFWDALHRALPSAGRRADEAFRIRAVEYATVFRAEIDRSAGQMLEQLRRHPATLNALRAARLGADAAALALAFQTGGIGLHDFLIAPAVLSLTSFLAEGAAGQILARAQVALKSRQDEAVNRLLTEVYREFLLQVALDGDAPGLYRVRAETIRAADAALEPEVGP